MECIGQGSARTNWQIYFNSPPLQSVFCEYYVHYNWAQLSTRTHYGVYQKKKRSKKNNIFFQLAPSTECIEPQGNLFLCSLSFNSHPLRSVSSLVAMFLPLVAFQLALTYGAYQQNCLILCFKICHFLLCN